MRIKRSFLNVLIGCLSYAVSTGCTLLIRGIFYRVVGRDFAGVESAFVNAISMLSVVELGIGTGIVFKLYQPIAEEDWGKAAALLRFYKHAYLVIASVIALIGGITAVFIPGAVKEFDRGWLSFIFLLYLADSLCSYLYANRRAMFVADQKNYVTTVCYMGGQIFNCAAQSVLLLVVGGMLEKRQVFVLYLCLRILSRLIENGSIALLFRRCYPMIDLRSRDRVPKEERNDLFSKMWALLVHKVSGLSLQSTSSLLVTHFVSTTVGGFYGNYVQLTNAINTVALQFFNGITAGFGDLYTREGKQAAYGRFRSVFLADHLLYSFLSVSFFLISEPFVELWIGTGDAVLPTLTVGLIAAYIYMYGVRQCIFVARNVTGEYTKDRWFAVIEAVINFAIGWTLVPRIGVIGIPMGNLISQFLVPFWTQPIIVYRDIFSVRVREYYKEYACYFFAFAVEMAGGYALCRVLTASSLVGTLAVRLAVCLVIPQAVNLLLFSRTAQFGYLRGAAAGLLGRFLSKKNG